MRRKESPTKPRKRMFDTVVVECVLTGSAVFGYEVPKDLDYLAKSTPALERKLKAAGFKECLPETVDDKGYPPGSFLALRRKFVNIILSRTDYFYETWIAAHDFCLKHPELAKTKDMRIMVFNHFRGTETSEIIEAFQKK